MKLGFAATLLVASSACQRTDAVVVDGGPDAAEGEGEAIVDACPDDVCTSGCAESLDGLCLPARIDADTPFSVTTTNDDCVGSTCTDVFASVCNVVVEDSDDGRRVVVTGNVCAQHDPSTGGCSEDCGGNSGGTCELPALAAGTYTLVVGDREHELTIPFARDSTGVCF